MAEILTGFSRSTLMVANKAILFEYLEYFGTSSAVLIVCKITTKRHIPSESQKFASFSLRTSILLESHEEKDVHRCFFY